MSMTRLKTIGLALCAGLILASCGSDKSASTLDMLKSIPASIKARRTPPPPISAAQIAQALQSTNKPVALFQLENRRNAQVLLSEVERNGEYQTFGNQARQAVVMRDGMITASRGLGGDLMSTEEDELLYMIQSRAGGNVSYVQRFLTPEYKTKEIIYHCSVRPGAGGHTPLGRATMPTSSVGVSCQAAGEASFENSYYVAGDGTIVSGRQWMGETLGYLDTQLLRY